MGDASHNSHVSADKESVARAQHGWHFFTKATVWSIIATSLVAALVIRILTF